MAEHPHIVPTTVQIDLFNVEEGDKFLVTVDTGRASNYKRQELVKHVVDYDPCLQHIRENGGNFFVSTANLKLTKVGKIEPDEVLVWHVNMGSLNRNEHQPHSQKIVGAINKWFPDNQNVITFDAGDRSIRIAHTQKPNFWQRLKYLFHPKSLR